MFIKKSPSSIILFPIKIHQLLKVGSQRKNIHQLEFQVGLGWNQTGVGSVYSGIAKKAADMHRRMPARYNEYMN